MTLERLDPLLTNPKRLASLGVVANSREVEFVFLRDVLELGDSDLSKQMSALAAADYVTVKKTGKGKQRRTWFQITRNGRAALKRHVLALNALVEDAPVAPEPTIDSIS